MAVANGFFQSKVKQSFDFLAAVKSTEGQFECDFHRTSEVKLLVNQKNKLHYIKSDFYDSENFNYEAEKVKNKFVKELRNINPELEIAVKKMMQQSGPFYSGRNALENIIFPRVGMRGAECTHKFIVEVSANNVVIVREISTYNSLHLNLSGFAKNISCSAEGIEGGEFTKMQKQALDAYRELNIGMYLPKPPETSLQEQTQEHGNYLLANDSQAFGDAGLVELDQVNIDKDYNFGHLLLSEPLSLTVEYKLYYDLEEKKFKVIKPTEADIDVNFPATIVEKLISMNFNGRINNGFRAITFSTKVQEKLAKVIAKFVEAVKKAFIVTMDKFFSGEESANNSFGPYSNRPRI
ncbi:MAG: hypothetical protein V4471_00125 [Pseudomonadota bacterium]